MGYEFYQAGIMFGVIAIGGYLIYRKNKQIKREVAETAVHEENSIQHEGSMTGDKEMQSLLRGTRKRCRWAFTFLLVLVTLLTERIKSMKSLRSMATRNMKFFITSHSDIFRWGLVLGRVLSNEKSTHFITS